MVKRAIVLGASGGMGYSIVKELVNRGIEVIAFARNEGKLQNMFSHLEEVTIRPGNLLNRHELKDATKEIDVVFNAVGLPYADWKKMLPIITDNVISAVKEQSLKLAVVDNIYAYGKNPGYPITELTPKQPHTRKGKLRLEMEKKIKNSGVTYLFAHFPDFYGPCVKNSMINYTVEQILSDKKARFVGEQTIPREYIYTPDGAKAIVELAHHDSAYGENWLIPGYGLITGKEIIRIIRQITGYQRPVGTATKNLIRFVGLFNRQMKEFVEMQYLTADPVVLNGDKYEKHIGTLPKTSYKQGLKETIHSYQKQA